MRTLIIAVALVGLSGCFGKLLDAPGSTTLADECAPDGGAGAALVGTWSCNMSSDSSQPYNPGSHGTPVTFHLTVQVSLAGNDKIAVGIANAGQTCNGLLFSVNGATATMDAPQSCMDPPPDEDTDSFTAGSFTLSTCDTASFSNADEGVPRGAPEQDYTIATTNGSCTRK